MEQIGITEYRKEKTDILIDLRDKRLYSFGTLEGAVNIPMDAVHELYALPKDKRIVLFCQSGDYSREVAELLSDNGYHVLNLTGGYRKVILEKG